MRRFILAGVLSAALLSGVAGCSVLSGLSGGSSGSGSSGNKGDGKIEQLPEKTVYLPGAGGSSSGVTATGTAARGLLASLPPLPSSYGSRAVPSFSPPVCTHWLRPGVVDGLTVVPGTTSATVTWWGIGDPSVTEYQLTAVSQRLRLGTPPPWVWQAVPKGTACTQMSATYTGLARQTPYVFVLHAMLKRYESLPSTEPEIARSEVVFTR